MAAAAGAPPPPPPPPPPGYVPTPGAPPGGHWEQPAPTWSQPQSPWGAPQPAWPPPAWPPVAPAWQQGPQAPFGAPLASWWSRVGAFLIDVAVLLVPTLLIQGVARAAGNQGATGTTSTATSIAVLLAGSAVSALYFGILNGVGKGQTLGNMALGIGVRDVHTGAAIGVGRGLLRWMVRYLLYFFLLPGILSDLWPLWDTRRQTLADKAANTVMIKLR